MKFNSLALRLAAAAVLWSVILLIVGGVLQVSLFSAYVERNFDARLQSYLDQMAATTLFGEDQSLSEPSLFDPRFRRIFSGWYWQIGESDDPIYRSTSLWDFILETPADASAESNDGFLAGPTNQELRFVTARFIPDGGHEPLAFTVAVDRSEVATEAAQFSNALLWSLRILGPWLVGLIIVGFVLFVVLQQRFGMRPLHRMSKTLHDIRAGRADRLEDDYPVELEPIARELNELIDHTKILIERARANAGDIAHMIKTPMSVMLNEAEQAEGPLADSVRKQISRLRTQIDHQLARARMAAGDTLINVRTNIGDVVRDLSRAMTIIHRDAGIKIEPTGNLDAEFRGEKEDLEEMLGNIMDNACKWAKGEVLVNAELRDKRVLITVQDNGPGLTSEECKSALERGKRLDETVPGTGLGLSTVSDIAEMYKGSLELDRAEIGGLRATLNLPAPD